MTKFIKFMLEFFISTILGNIDKMSNDPPNVLACSNIFCDMLESI